jgi:thiol-disulfide isomerase/thioredoxin
MSRTIAASLAALLVLSACAAGDSGSSQPSAGDPTATADPSTAAPTAGTADPSESPGETEDPLLAYELVDVVSGERFTLGELAADAPVLVETMAIWCSTCLTQQRQVVRAHAQAEFHSVGIDVDPNEDPEDLAAYAAREGFDWRFVKADAGLVKLLTDRYGFGVTNPPSTPTFVVADGEVRALEFGRLRSADELIAELGAG